MWWFKNCTDIASSRSLICVVYICSGHVHSTISNQRKENTHAGLKGTNDKYVLFNPVACRSTLYSIVYLITNKWLAYLHVCHLHICVCLLTPWIKSWTITFFLPQYSTLKNSNHEIVRIKFHISFQNPFLNIACRGNIVNIKEVLTRLSQIPKGKRKSLCQN